MTECDRGKSDREKIDRGKSGKVRVKEREISQFTINNTNICKNVLTRAQAKAAFKLNSKTQLTNILYISRIFHVYIRAFWQL